MVTENDNCPVTSEMMDTSSTRQSKICKNYASSKKGRRTCYCICLGILAEMVNAQIENNYVQNDNLYRIGLKYIKDFSEWIYQYRHKQLFVEDFLSSFITSAAFFAVGVKLTSELVAWRLP